MYNTAYMVAVVSKVGEESILSGDIRKAIIRVRLYNSENKISTAMLMLSELGELKRATGIGVGDVILFSATLSEGVKDTLVFHPNEIYVLRKGLIPANELSDKLIDSRLLPYRKEKNLVVLEGSISLIEKNYVCLVVENKEALRGSSDKDHHLWVNNTNKRKKLKTGDKVVFVGEYSDGELKGRIYS